VVGQIEENGGESMESEGEINNRKEETSDSAADLKQFIRDYIEDKKWSLRAYCRDTDRKLGWGNGIPVATLSFILRGDMRISTAVVLKIAEYHDLPVPKALEMAGYYETRGEPKEKTMESLIALREQARAFVQQLDAIIDTL
jgi:hypothetical protein